MKNFDLSDVQSSFGGTPSNNIFQNDGSISSRNKYQPKIIENRGNYNPFKVR